MTDGVEYSTKKIGDDEVTFITYSVVDGSVFDDDGQANEKILDPAGPAIRNDIQTDSNSLLIWVWLFPGIGTIVLMGCVGFYTRNRMHTRQEPISHW